MDILHTEMIDLERVADLLAAGTGRRSPPAPRDHSKYHVSNLLESAQRITKGDVRYHDPADAPSGIMSMGRIWESAIDCFLSDYSIRNGGLFSPDVEREEDGIIASLDGLLMLPDGLDYRWLVCETKLRFSTGDEIPLRHQQQIMACCHLADTDQACYVSGHIGSRPPTVEAWLRILRFAPLNIAETWGMILSTKQFLEKNGCVPGGVAGRCGMYADCWEELGKPEGWKGCPLPAGHSGNHSDGGERL